MIKIQREVIEQIEQVTEPAGLNTFLQNAIELEHATIPVYLTAILSIKPNTQTYTDVQPIIDSIMMEEMLHMTIACNVLTAIGGTPSIGGPGFIPDFPSKLPMGVDNDLVVGCTALSKDAVFNTYMAIEEPENPIHFPTAAMRAALPTFATIGQFYNAIIGQIKVLYPNLSQPFPNGGNTANQVTEVFHINSQKLPTPIVTPQDAVNGLNLIIEQGEGTPTSPTDPNNELAHYYKFAEIYHGNLLVVNPSAPDGYSYTGAAITLNQADVYNLNPNTKLSQLAGTTAYAAAVAFTQTYASLLSQLNTAFTGTPSTIGQAIGTMYGVSSQGGALAATPWPTDASLFVGPVFENPPAS